MKEYTVLINGLPHTMLLDPEDAKQRGAVEVVRKANVPANKSRASDLKTKD